MKPIDLERGYKIYLDMIKLKEADMHPIQRIETKRAFMGGVAFLFLAIKNDISAPNVTEDDAVAIMDRLEKDISTYWLNEMQNKN